MNIRPKILSALLLCALAPAAFAQQQPLLSVNMTELDVLNPTGSMQTYYAIYGSNPLPRPPGNPGSAVNGGFGPATDEIVMWALATGILPSGGFTYTFYVDGQSLATAINGPTGVTDTSPYAQGVAWTPPQPGVYYLSVQAADGGGHTAVSVPIEYFATGVAIVGPANNQIVPYQSSVVVEAAAAVAFGAISKVEFYADGALLGTSTNYPYSIIYTPTPVASAGVAGKVHFLYAKAYDATGASAGVSTSIGIVDEPATPNLPTCIISNPTGTPSLPGLLAIPDYAANSSASIPINVTANSPTGTIEQVQLFINGVLYGTLTSPPFTFNWTPQVTGTYTFVALATDDKNNVIASTTSTTATLTPAPTTVVLVNLPTVSITSPANGDTLNGGGPATLIASATATNVLVPPNNTPFVISQVQFSVDGSVVGTSTSPSPAGSSLYSTSFTPIQKTDPTTGAILPSTVTAVATESVAGNGSFSATSSAITINITAGGSGGGGSTNVGTPPTISLVTPSANASVVVNTPATISATATAPNGNVAQVTFLVDDQAVYTAKQYPYTYSWTPQNLGFYTITAQVVDNLGDKTNSTPITVYVVNEPPPTVSITSPSSGGLVTVNTAVTVTASAVSSSGTIGQVQFFENGISIGTATTFPYTATFTPTSAGVYSLTAIATDNSGEQTTSPATVIEATPSTSGVATTIYYGNYQGLKESGHSFLAVVDGKYGYYIGHSVTPSAASTTVYSGFTVSSTGTFSTSSISGTASSTGVSGTLLASGDDYIASVPLAATYTVATGYFTGNLGGVANSSVQAMVAADGSIMLYYTSGTYSDAGDGIVDSTGAFTFTTVNGNQVSGTVKPASGFLSASISGTNGGNALAAPVSGGIFSDGVLRNLSTRGQVGSGANVMIAGFVVSGSASKQVLVRASGPALTGFGVSGAIPSTQLQIYSGTNLIASNTGWSSTPSNASAVESADAASGAFAFASGSNDSALVATLPPGAYTAEVSGVGTDTGISLVEAYDLSTYTPFTSNRLINVSTRANVGTGANNLIGGFSFNGTAPKRLLIRGAGPGLTALGVSGALSAPRLQLINSANQVVRENYAWGLGNDPTLFQAAEASTGAFAFTTGSADSGILAVLPPDTYTAVLTGQNGATGVALVEVYEITSQ